MAITTLEREVTEQDSYRPLGISSDVNLTDEQFDSLSRLERFEAPYVEEKLLKDGKLVREDYQEAFTEFKRYVALVNLNKGRGAMSMSSKEVDEVWHQFILFTPQYHEFCDEVLGRYLHHVPTTSQTPSTPTGKANFIRNYTNAFGEIPEIWNINLGSDPCDAGNCVNPPEDCTPCSND